MQNDLINTFCELQSLHAPVPAVPDQSLRRGRQKSISPQGSGFRKRRAPILALLNEFTPSNTLAWWVWTRCPHPQPGVTSHTLKVTPVWLLVCVKSLRSSYTGLYPQKARGCGRGEREMQEEMQVSTLEMECFSTYHWLPPLNTMQSISPVSPH